MLAAFVPAAVSIRGSVSKIDRNAHHQLFVFITPTVPVFVCLSLPISLLHQSSKLSVTTCTTSGHCEGSHDTSASA